MGLISGLRTVVLMTIQNLLCESLALFNCPPETAATGASFCLCGYPNSARPRVSYFWERILGFWTSLVKVPEPKFVDLQGTLHNLSISPGISLTEEYMSCFNSFKMAEVDEILFLNIYVLWMFQTRFPIH